MPRQPVLDDRWWGRAPSGHRVKLAGHPDNGGRRKRYRVRAWDPTTGRECFSRSYGEQEHEQAKAKVRELAAQQEFAGPPGFVPKERGLYPFDAYATDWLASHRVRSGSRVTYANALAHARAFYGAAPLASIDAGSVQRLMAQLEAGGMGAARRNAVLSRLRQVLQFAILDNRLTANAARAVKLARVAETTARPFTAEQVGQLASAINPRYRLLVLLLASTGMRIGEALALTCGDARRVVTVAHSVRKESGAGRVVGPTKTGAERYLSVSDRVLALLREHAAGRPKDEPMFLNVHGRPATYDAFMLGPWRTAVRRLALRWDAREAAWVPIGDASRDELAGARLLPTPHNLRDTWATRSLEAGADVNAVAYALGHANPKMTIKHYVTVTKEGRARLAAISGDLLGTILDGGETTEERAAM